MAVNKSLTMQDDESLLLDPWLRYCGHMLDIPVDCDEFIAVLLPDGLSCSRTAIHRALDALIGDLRTLGIEFSMFNIPGAAACYRPRFHPEGFFFRDTVETIDGGYHYQIAGTAGRRETEPAYLHHHTPFVLMLEHSHRKRPGSIDPGRPELAADHTGTGTYLVRRLTVPETGCHAQFDHSPMIRIDALDHVPGILGPLDPDLFCLGGSVPVRTADRDDGDPDSIEFPEDEYHRFDPDVAAHRIEALKHYFRHGFEEGRSVRSDGAAMTERMA